MSSKKTTKAARGERRVEMMPLASIKPAARNPHGHDLGALHQSVGRFGFVEMPVLDERTGRIVAGHGRLETLLAMHAEHPDLPPEGVALGKGGTWLVPVTRGWSSRTDAEAEAYLLASNRTVELGGWDDVGLAEMLKELATAGELSGTGYDGDDVDSLLARLSAETVKASGTDLDEGIAGDVKMAECPKCGERFAP